LVRRDDRRAGSTRQAWWEDKRADGAASNQAFAEDGEKSS